MRLFFTGAQDGFVRGFDYDVRIQHPESMFEAVFVFSGISRRDWNDLTRYRYDLLYGTGMFCKSALASLSSCTISRIYVPGQCKASCLASRVRDGLGEMEHLAPCKGRVPGFNNVFGL
jgi:hypothetical protein